MGARPSGIKRLFNKIAPRIFPFSDGQLTAEYVRAGGIFGDAVSYIYMGECIGFAKLLKRWAKLEKEYSARGYRTVSLDEFIEYGGYGKPIEGLGIKRSEDEKIVLHAEIYRAQYLGNIEPAIDMNELMKGKVQTGTYQLPSTKDKD